MLPIHQQFINQAMEKIRQDSRLTGLLVGGSVIRRTERSRFDRCI
ncbi:hypothetical protein EEL55_012115 [Bacillus thuringiensis]|nr:hypothetical protein [Bacillus thuringiensis]WMR10296.1 hypothetical protein RCI28_31410 [Bacillus thuringiensis serovar tenebrionis]WMR15839.1 hypothetical protein RCI27_29790 [Bacillus thuringiensis serovar tenebrionis]WMR21863.1 hypothetical protein RCI26_29765 [Bacillus thuringiensis serovar tenebrionis]